jgi:hypothetical protein
MMDDGTKHEDTKRRRTTKTHAGVRRFLTGFFITLLGILLMGADAGGQKVSVADVQTGRVALAGHLGSPLGTFVNIEGTREERPIKSANPMRVDTVDGKRLATPVVLEIQGVKELPKGERCVLRGYETGTMAGSPLDPLVNYTSVPQQNYHLAVWFEVTEVKEPATLEKLSKR